MDAKNAKLLLYCLSMIDDEGEKRHFEDIFRKYEGMIMATSKKYLDDKSMREEVVLETFTKVAKQWSLISKYDDEKMKALLLQILRYTAIDMYRKECTRKRKELNYQTIPEEFHTGYSKHIVDIAYAIKCLPDKYRSVMVLKYYFGYDNLEIASLLNTSKYNIDKIVTRGKRKLENLLREQKNN